MSINEQKSFKDCSTAQVGKFISLLHGSESYKRVSYYPVDEKSHFERFGYICGDDKISIVYDTKANILSITAKAEQIAVLSAAYETGVLQRTEVANKKSNMNLPANQEKNSQKLPAKQNDNTQKLPANQDKNKQTLPANQDNKKQNLPVNQDNKKQNLPAKQESKQKLPINRSENKNANLPANKQAAQNSTANAQKQSPKQQAVNKTKQQPKGQSQKQQTDKEKQGKNQEPTAGLAKSNKQNKAAEKKLKRLLPSAYDYLSSLAKSDLISALTDIYNDEIRLSDYSGLLVSPYRGLERLIYDLQVSEGIRVKMIGQAYEKRDDGSYCLKSGYRKRIKSIVYNEIMSALYTEYFEKRNFYLHSNNSLSLESRVIKDKTEARKIFDNLLAIIEYNGAKLREIRFSVKEPTE